MYGESLKYSALLQKIEGSSVARTKPAKLRRNEKMPRRKNEENEMTATLENPVETVSENQNESLIKVQVLKPKLKVIDLDNIENDDVQIEIAYNKYDFDSKADQNQIARELEQLVSPLLERNRALANFATSRAYQLGKEQAFAGKNLVTPDVRKRITDYMSMTGKFEDLSAKEMFVRWLEGYRAGKSGAKTILARVTEAASDEISEL